MSSPSSHGTVILQFFRVAAVSRSTEALTARLAMYQCCLFSGSPQKLFPSNLRYHLLLLVLVLVLVLLLSLFPSYFVAL